MSGAIRKRQFVTHRVEKDVPAATKPMAHALVGLKVVECRNCGGMFWADVAKAGCIDGGPCCFGHKVIDVERYPTERAAQKVYLQWLAYQKREVEKAMEENKAGRLAV